MQAPSRFEVANQPKRCPLDELPFILCCCLYRVARSRSDKCPFLVVKVISIGFINTLQ